MCVKAEGMSAQMRQMVTCGPVLSLLIAISLVTAGCGPETPVHHAEDGWSACSQHWLGSNSPAAYDAASLTLRGHVIDCTTLFNGSLPADSAVIAEGKKQDTAEEADRKAAEDFLTCKLGRKPNDKDSWNELRRTLKDKASHKKGHTWAGIEHYSASYIAYLHRCAQRITSR